MVEQQPEVIYAIAWAALAMALSAIPGIAGLFRKRPGAPQFPSTEEAPGGLTPEQEKRMLDAVRRRIGGQKQGLLETTRSRAGSRGFYRSGQLPQMELDIEKSASQDFSDAALQLELDKAGRTSRWAELRERSRLDRYRTEIEGYYRETGAAGGGLGSLASLLPYLFGGGRNTAGSSSRYAQNRPRTNLSRPV
ncbi:hypothetical protein LCGC14_0412340 [marine sediment metagenome]|uniref:Uncharacterized protein n=1 Tax=marine sediment metagenome TaxID=412755 RepID=A0A0F9W2L8_9ZZZZ